MRKLNSCLRWLFLMLSGISILTGCTKDADKASPLQPGTILHWVKSGSGPVQNEFVYNEEGSIKTRIFYKNFSQNLISAKEELSYKNGRLQSANVQIDFSSSMSGVQYDYSKIEYEYNQSGLVIQRNFFGRQGDAYKLRSFIVYEYNNEGLPTRETRFDDSGVSYGYNTYAYDGAGNVITKEEFAIDRSSGATQLQSKSTFKHNSANNPYKKVYHLTELIPFSVNNNNITEQIHTSYGAVGLGIPVSSETSYGNHNAQRYPLTMNENGNLFSFEYY